MTSQARDDLLAEMRQARREVDKFRAVHSRLQLELEWLNINPRKNQLAIQRFELERDSVRRQLRAASRKLIRSV